jgi:hypothetical protein
VMRSLRLGVNDRLRHVLLTSDGFQKLDFNLSKLHFALVVSDLVSESDLHRCVIV